MKRWKFKSILFLSLASGICLFFAVFKTQADTKQSQEKERTSRIGKEAKVSTAVLIVRHLPSQSANIIGKLKSQDVVKILDISKEIVQIDKISQYWYKISFTQGNKTQTGWAFGGYLKIDAVFSTQADTKGFKVLNIAATSELAPSANFSYKAGHIMDGTLWNSWVEGKADDGIGESVKITLSEEAEFPVIRIANGFGVEKHWAANNRVKELIISTDTGQKKQVTLHDIMMAQTLPLPAGFKGKVFTFTIGSVYKGTKWRDTAIAEISLGFGYKDNGNGTVYDPMTNLTWMKCSLGQSGNDCQGDGKLLNWQSTINECKKISLSGKKTWRLPAKDELPTLVYCSNGTVTSNKESYCGKDNKAKYSQPTIDRNIFPNTIADYYWSSTTGAYLTSVAWYVNFGNGDVNGNDKTSTYYARCVSTGP